MTAIPDSVFALEIAGHPIVRTIPPRAVDRGKMRSARRGEAEQAGRADPCAGGTGGEIAGKKAVVLEIQVVVALVKVPRGGRYIPSQKRLVRALRRRRSGACRCERGGCQQNSQSAHDRAIICNMAYSSPNRL